MEVTAASTPSRTRSSVRRRSDRKSCASTRSTSPSTSSSPSSRATYLVSTHRATTRCRGRACRAPTPVSGRSSRPTSPRPPPVDRSSSAADCPSSRPRRRRRRRAAHSRSPSAGSTPSPLYSVRFLLALRIRILAAVVCCRLYLGSPRRSH